MTRHLVASAGAVLLASGLWACSDGTATPTPATRPAAVASLAVSGSAPIIGGSPRQFTAMATLSNGGSQNVSGSATWESSNTAVASVSSGGAVSAVAAGETDIRASYQGVAGTARIAVAPPPTYTLAGVLTDGSTLRAVGGAVVSVLDGLNAGRATTTDGNGYYSLGELRTGTFTLQAVVGGYSTVTRPVALTGDLRLDFSLSPASGGGGTLTCGASTVPSIVDCPNNGGRQAPTAKCGDGTYSCSQNRSGTCSSHGGVTCFVCPGVLCNPLSPFGELLAP